MSTSFFSDLLRTRTRDGHDATPQDFQDALRSLTDAYEEALLNADDRMAAICSALVCPLVEASKQPRPPF